MNILKEFFKIWIWFVVAAVGLAFIVQLVIWAIEYSFALGVFTFVIGMGAFFSTIVVVGMYLDPNEPKV